MIAGPFDTSAVDRVLPPSVGRVNEGSGDPTARFMRKSGRVGRRREGGRVDWRRGRGRRVVSGVRVNEVMKAIPEDKEEREDSGLLRRMT